MSELPTPFCLPEYEPWRIDNYQDLLRSEVLAKDVGLTQIREAKANAAHIAACDPTTCPALLAEIRGLQASLDCRGIHTCHDECVNPFCVTRKERDRLVDAAQQVVTASAKMKDPSGAIHRLALVLKSTSRGD